MYYVLTTIICTEACFIIVLCDLRNMNVNNMEKETNMGSSNNEDKDVLIERDGCNNSCNEDVDRNKKNGSSEHAQKYDGLQATSTELSLYLRVNSNWIFSSATERSASFETKMEAASDRKPPTGARLVVEIFAKTGERRWRVALSPLVVSILALLVGLSIAFASNAVLDLQGDATDLPQDYLFSTLLYTVFFCCKTLHALDARSQCLVIIALL